MTDPGGFHCPSCKMRFRSRQLLEKHMEKFCIGGEITNDARDQKRQALRRGKEPRQTEKSDGMHHQPEEPEAKIHHFKHYENGAHKQEAYQLRSSDHEGDASDSQALRKLTEEFHKLKMSLEDTVPAFKTFQTEDENKYQMLHQQEFWQRQQQMAEAYEHQLADIQARNQYLEQQRDEIHRHLSEMKLGHSSTSQIEQLLMELKAQEGKNLLALDALREQIGLLQAATESRSKLGPPTNRKTSSAADKMGKKGSLKLLPFPAAVGPLSSEIQALYLAYVQSGNDDPNMLKQMYDLQVEAIALEKAGTRSERKSRKKKHEGSPNTYPWSLDAELLTVELQNQRLEDEILKLKIQRDRRRMEDGCLDKELADLQQVHMAEMAQLQAEIGMLRYNSEKMKPQWPKRGSQPLPPPIAPPLALLPSQHHPGLPDPTVPVGNMKSAGSSPTVMSQYFLHPSDTLGPAPYDPASGFVVFYDFLLGLNPTFYQVCLVSGLYRNGQELGKSTPLPIVSSDMGQSPYHVMGGQRGCCAILAARQPVPRVLPSTSIALVTELQASGGFDAYGQEIQHLAPRGWAKIHLFDHLHQVLSGHWKVPIRVLPVKPGLTADQLNSVPQAGKAELYLRLVNARDADMQSLAEIHPGNAPLYKYPPLITTDIGPPASLPPAPHAFQLSSSRLSFAIPPYIGIVDPPPAQEQPFQPKIKQR